MKYQSIFILYTLFIFSGFICAKSTGDNSPLPENRPQNIRFSYSLSGGMMYYSENIFISKDSCFYSINFGGTVSRVNFKLSESELDKLYRVFVENRFDKIKTYEEMVYDRGGESISLNWGKGNIARVSNSGITFVKDSWSAEWNACLRAMVTLAKDRMNEQLKTYEIKLDSSLFGKECYIQINQNIVFPKSKLIAERDDEKEIIKHVKLSPGYHRASVTVGKYSKGININADSTTALIISLENDSLRYEFVK